MAFGDFTVDRNSTKYVLGSGGTIVPVATDEPAFEFNADGTYKGLLVEPAATNLALQSENFITSWGSSNATVTANATTAPDGNTTADKIEITAASGSISQNFTSSATTYTFSVWLKQGNTTVTDIQIVDVLTLSYRIRLTWATGALSVVGGTATATKINELSNGWFRISVTATLPAGGTDNISIKPAGDGLGTSGDYVYVWGAQLETGPIATSYIPTASAQVTRVKDDITQTGAQSLIGQTEGTLYLEVDWREASGVSQYLFSVNDGTGSNRMVILNTSGILYMYTEAGGVNLNFNGESSSGYSGIQKFAFAYKTDDFELYRNGSSIATDISGSLAALATMTDIDLGQRYDASAQANMHIRAVALYPTRLGAVELEVLTGAPTYGSYALMASSLGYTVE